MLSLSVRRVTEMWCGAREQSATMKVDHQVRSFGKVVVIDFD
jgi:hypothetical protein